MPFKCNLKALLRKLIDKKLIDHLTEEPAFLEIRRPLDFAPKSDEDDSLMTELFDIEKCVTADGHLTLPAGYDFTLKRHCLASVSSDTSVPSLTNSGAVNSVGDSDDGRLNVEATTTGKAVGLNSLSPSEIKRNYLTDIPNAVVANRPLVQSHMTPVSEVLDSKWGGSSAGFTLVSLEVAHRMERIKRLTERNHLYP